MMSGREEQIETLLARPSEYSHKQIMGAIRLAAALERGKLVLCMPPDPNGPRLIGDK